VKTRALPQRGPDGEAAVYHLCRQRERCPEEWLSPQALRSFSNAATSFTLCVRGHRAGGVAPCEVGDPGLLRGIDAVLPRRQPQLKRELRVARWQGRGGCESEVHPPCTVMWMGDFASNVCESEISATQGYPMHQIDLLLI